MPSSKQKTIDERLAEHSRRIRLMEEVFMPMARASMEILNGKDGQPGMAENVRNIRADLEELIQSQKAEQSESRAIRKDGFDRIGSLEDWRRELDMATDIKMAGVKMSANTKIALINGLFVLLTGLVTYFASR